MVRKLDRWTTAASVALVLGALLACKKKTTETTTVVLEAAAPVATAEPPKPVEPAKDEVKRYGADELAETGTVKVSATAKVFREADATSEGIISLAKGTLVNRLARKDTFVLIEYPSGVGELSPGWVESRLIGQTALNLKTEDVRKQDAAAAIIKKPDASAPKVDASSPAANATATATGTSTATAAPTTTAAPTATATAAPTATSTAPAATPDAGRRRIPRRLSQ
ncbi:MAG TPA: hypothetical protein VK524_05730 [Polyangiaceae bacterium]|nr:hypothetical protein [Polyangiaceae bacterium]